ncbi:hypothetical protein [Labilibacter marinus]|uniref:hypothetical protein n=1 Tax=Labilibacter marinus TaxID=1477105 RepID=UPI000829D676|nr:hypothetical protein [Labilibacter marinus]
MRYYNFLLFVFLTFSITNAQVSYDFEDEAKWNTNANWSISSNEAAKGSKSLNYLVNENSVLQDKGLVSIETGHTIQKVRVAKENDNNYIVASSYEGVLMGVSYGGNVLWKNNLTGYMVHDIWCADITGDNTDEIIVATADGCIIAIDAQGKTLWKFQDSEVPMYATCVVKKGNTPYVVCGGLDLNMYYLSAQGALVKTIASSTYSEEKTWGIDKKYDYLHYANFLRPITKADGTQVLAMHASDNHMQAKGSIYLFEVLADEPYQVTKVDATSPIGEFRVSDYNNDGTAEILLGVSSHQKSASISRLDLATGTTKDDWLKYEITGLGFGYTVAQPELIKDGSEDKYLVRVGNHIVLINTDLSSGEEKIACNYAFNDMWKDGNKIILASVQSGGSNIHILDTQHADWKKSFKAISPTGKLQKMKDNHEAYRVALEGYSKPADERNPRKVYLMTENTDDGIAKAVADNIRSNYQSPIFLGGSHTNKAEDWDRSAMANEKYKNKRDGRRQYVYSRQQCLDLLQPWYNNEPGIAYWGGHGNDPYMFHIETTKQVLDYADGKKTVLIYPELEDHSDDFAWVMEDLFYPLANYAKDKNANIFVRTKHNFWQGNIYLPMWEKVMDGDYANVFVPAMEETTDKAMDISIAARSGVWASGAFTDWGTRAVPDNPSFDRSRQFSHQRLPSHFLRHIVYHMACGATYINNFSVDQDYMSILWDLIAKGALYVPESNEIVSYSPVHLSMKDPDEHYMTESSNVKWSVFYDEEFENNNPFVFSRQNGTWPAAKVNEWDFSNYAGGVKDRRQNYLPSYPSGLVLITPPQDGVYARAGVSRGKLTDHLHPIYKDIMREYITDGRFYYSADGTQTFNANEYSDVIANDIKQLSNNLPLTVEGDVAWVVAQTGPKKLRLTVIDGGYLNPNDREAIITFNSVTPVKMNDILDKTNYDISNKSNVKVEVPCGLFRFIEIELQEEL